jgi:excisionase family DNA binding protein
MSNIPRKPVQTVTSTSLGPENVHLALDLEPYVNASDAADFLGIHPKTLMRLARDRVVPAYSFTDGTRHRWRFLKSELDIWMRSRVNSTSHPLRSVS